MSNNAKPTLIQQLIPAQPGWHVHVIETGTDGKRILSDGKPLATLRHVACWALNSNGEVVPMILCQGGVGLKQAQLAVGSWDYSILGPDESYEYGVSYGGNDGIVEPPLPGDAEAIAISENEDSISVLWRWRNK